MNVRSDTSKHIFLQGTVVLTLAGLLIKIMSAAYRVPYQNIVGDIGFYIYQQVYPFYGIAIMLATTGFPVIVSKLMIEFGDKGNSAANSTIIKASFIYLFTVGFSCFLSLYIGADAISAIMGDQELAPLLRIISFSFLLVPFISILRGYFQGEEDMLPTAMSQVTEQGIRVITILFFSYILIRNGYSLYEAGEGALFGSLTGGLAAFTLLSIFWVKNRKVNPFISKGTPPFKSTLIMKYLFKHTLTICITSLMIIFIQLIDAMQLYSALLANGMETTAAKALKGIYDRGQPLIQLGTVVATSFSLSLVPIIAFAKKHSDEALIASRITMSLKICTAVGAGAAAGLIMIMEPVNIMLFRNESGTEILSIISLSVFFTSFSLTLCAILQGLNHTVFPAISVLIGTMIKLVLNILLVPAMNTEGAAIATVAAYAAITALNAFYLKSKGYRLISLKDIFKTIAATAIMAAALFLYLSLFNQYWDGRNRTAAVIISLSGTGIGGMIYLIAILKFSIFTKKELAGFPLGGKLQKFLK